MAVDYDLSFEEKEIDDGDGRADCGAGVYGVDRFDCSDNCARYNEIF